jgi:peptidoglycan/LPS O-acetylase OafA/YrhL
MASRTTWKSKREPLLDIARVVACFIVVMHHAAIVLHWSSAKEIESPVWSSVRSAVLTFLKFGTGTPIFFALAGFLVMGTLERTGGNRAGIARSLARRIRRIIPPYWLAMGLTAGLFLVMEFAGLKSFFSGGHALEFASPNDLTKTQWLGNLALIETWRPLYSAEPGAIFTRVAWTLCYHEQFIALAMILAIVAGSLWRRWLVIASIALMAFQLFLHDIGALFRAEGLFLDRWFVFGSGLLAWEIAARGRNERIKWSLTAILVAGLVGGCWAKDVEVQIAAGTSLLLAFASPWIGERISDDRAKFWAGLAPWTYPIFLMHLPAETISIRIMTEMGLMSFWERVLIVVPISMACGVAAGVAFGKLVNFLDSVTIQKSDLISAGNWIIAKSGLSPLRISLEGGAMSIRSSKTDELPRQVREGLGGLKSSVSANRLSDQTPWPNSMR